MLRKARKNMNLMMTLMWLIPLTTIAVFAVFFNKYMYVSCILAIIFFIVFLIAFLEARKRYKKEVELVKKYQGVKYYISEEQKKEKERRRKQFIEESKYHNKLDEIYFGEKKSEELPNDYMKKEESGYQTLGGYIYSMNNNLFLESLKRFKGTRSLEQVCYDARINTDILELLVNPDYRINRAEAIKFCLALNLDLYQASVLLSQAGYRLDKLREYDAAICYFIENKLYNIDYVNLALLSINYQEL